ncbi:hypothetical protein ACF0H5_018328 [Mactra antiquata]
MNIHRMKYNLSIICIYICFTVCSMDKLENDKSQQVQKKEKEKEAVRRRYSPATFKSKEEIPPDYLEFLKETLSIKQDPLKEHEDRLRENGLPVDNPDYEMLYEDGGLPYSSDYKDYDALKDANETYSEANETCPVCVQKELNKQLRLESIKQTILKKVGFTSNNLPNMTGKTVPKIPSIQHLLEEQWMQSDAPYEETYTDEEDVYGQVKRAYTIAQKPPEFFYINVPGGSYFDFSESVTSRKIQDASLWIYIKKTPYKLVKPLEIYIYEKLEKANPEHSLKGPIWYQKAKTSGWLEFKLSHEVNQWLRQPNVNKCVVIQALDDNGENLVYTPDDTENEDFYPVLEMRVRDYAHNRKKRSYPNNICEEDENVESCCRYPLRVSFVQFGWDWVIAPTGYNANYCSGKCRFRHLENNPSAYILQQAPAGVGPCCTPSLLYPLSMLYFDNEGNILYTHMQKMIVERCGCA